jgi:hypothetical protein
MRKIIGIGVVIVLLVGLKFYHKGEDDKAVLADMKSIVAELGASPADTAYLNKILDREHQRAFDAAYDIGGRRRAAKLDEDKYIQAIFKAMISQCNKDKKKQLADKLRLAQTVLTSSEDS